MVRLNHFLASSKPDIHVRRNTGKNERPVVQPHTKPISSPGTKGRKATAAFLCLGHWACACKCSYRFQVVIFRSSPQMANKCVDRRFGEFTHRFFLHCLIFFHLTIAALFVLHSVTLLGNSWGRKEGKLCYCSADADYFFFFNKIINMTQEGLEKAYKKYSCSLQKPDPCSGRHSSTKLNAVKSNRNIHASCV